MNMQLVTVERRAPTTADSVPPKHHGMWSSTSSWTSTTIESQRSATVQAHQRAGGMMCSDDVLRLLRQRSQQPISVLARWIVAQEVVCVEWQSQWLLPRWQFDFADMSIRPEVARVLVELAGTFDNWELAHWFVAPSVWLDGGKPLESLAIDPLAVLAAARADRFIARG